jgi:3-phenylpropionate/cinnamic acid dioxygenase small subunit
MNTETMLRDLLDRDAVRDLVVRFANAFDLRDWNALRACLAAEIFVDYSAFRGEPPRTVTAEAYVDARASALAALRTQHLSTNHQVTLAGDRAECFSAFLIHRVAPAAPAGADTFDTAGHYWHGCARTPDGWRIDRIRQTVLWTRGTPEIHGAFRTPA